MNYIFTIVVVTIIVLSLVTGGGNLLLCLLLLLWIFELQLNMSLNHTLLPKKYGFDYHLSLQFGKGYDDIHTYHKWIILCYNHRI